jgi:hypothetical protein
LTIFDEQNRSDEHDAYSHSASEEAEQGSETAPQREAAEEREDEREVEIVASPSDLLEHIPKMVSSLEQVWSDALDTESAARARDDAAGVWQSFVTAFGQWTEQTSKIAKSLGADRIMEEFPLDDAGLARLDLEPPDLAWQYYQLQVASIYAAQNFMESLEGLTNPSLKRVHLFAGGQAEMETWWEAGAFSLIRLRAKTLARLLREQEACLRELAERSETATQVPGESAVAPSAWTDPLSAAGTLVNRGWHAAALPYLLLALRSLLAKAADLANDDIYPRLSLRTWRGFRRCLRWRDQ